MGSSGRVVFWRSLQSCLVFATGCTKPSSSPRGKQALKRGFDFSLQPTQKSHKKASCIKSSNSLRIEGLFLMKHCFNLVVKVCFSMSSGRVLQCQGRAWRRLVLEGWRVSGGVWLADVSDCRCQWPHDAGEGHSTYILYQISSVQLIGLFGFKEGKAWVLFSFFCMLGTAVIHSQWLRS